MAAVVLTGSSGFLGRHLCAGLRQCGVDVIAPLRNAAAAAHDGAGVACAGWGRFRAADAAPAALLGSVLPLLGGSQPSAVIHVATCYGRRDESDAEMEQANVALPTAALALAKRAGARGFINIDTVLAADASRYAASKARFRRLLQRWAGDSAMPVVNLRMEHLYGPGDAGDRFVPWLIERCRAGDTAVALGRGDREREFVHVADAVAACLSVLRGLSAWPAGWHDTRVCGERTSIRQLAESVRALVGGTGTALQFGARAERPDEIERSLPDDRMLRASGWRRCIPLAEGLRATVLETA